MSEKTGWVELASENVGKTGGHTSEDDYQDVDVRVCRRGTTYRVNVMVTWGSSQGYGQEHGRRRIMGVSNSLDGAVEAAEAGVILVGLTPEYATQVLSIAHADAVDAEDSEENSTNKGDKCH